MKQSIKNAIQSTKILENYAECSICEFNSNNNLLYTRHVPINIYNKYKASDYTNALNHTKDQIAWFSWVFKEFQRERWGKEDCTTVFILVHSITELHPVYQDNLSLVFTIFKSFTNHKPILHFWTQNTQDFWLTKI